MPVPRYLTTDETAELLRTPKGTLAQWRYRGVGPKYSKTEGKVLYSEDHVHKYMRDREHVPSARANVEARLVHL
ncbi:helix-turn-helix domain-containing protein [Terriglobus albidus]|uniref:helix-turn-helix domain-containing protein n=1 Tax=Terriglobus albidus TaxID=1592106 RepID=UPI0037DA6CE4